MGAIPALKKWKLKELDEAIATALKTKTGLSRTIAGILTQRGITDERQAHEFLYPDLSELKPPFGAGPFEEACRLIHQTIQSSGKIVIYGDYDVDGTCSTVILVDFLRKLGANVSYYLPDRFTEGYSLNLMAVDKIKKEGTDLLITVDCGISNFREIQHARDLGLRVIVTDHHRVPTILPPADVILHPGIAACKFRNDWFAGIGVAYYLLIVFRRYLLDSGVIDGASAKSSFNLRKYLDLVALATVADVVPLTGENRILVKVGLKVMEEPAAKGLYYLKELSGVNGSVSTFDVGFKLAPRLNAGGRMGSATKVVELFLANEERIALSLARELHALNDRRRETQGRIMDEILASIESEPKKYRKSIVLYSRGWHEGVLGICAGKLVEKYGVPAFVLTDSKGNAGLDMIKGSGRSIPGVDLFRALSEIQKEHGLFEKHGGHGAAAGVSLKIDAFPEFVRYFDEYLSFNFSDGDFEPSKGVDMALSFSEIDGELVSCLKLLEPFGERNPEPLFMTKGLHVERSRVMKEKHWRGFLVDPSSGRGFDAVAFNLADRFESSQEPLSVVYALRLNEFNGRSSIELHIRDVAIP